MGAPKLKKYPREVKRSAASKQSTTSSKTKHTNKSSDPKVLKNEIEHFRNAINKKLKDPKMAKKAAQILEDLLNEVVKKSD